MSNGTDCPPGFERNPQTGECIPIVDRPITVTVEEIAARPPDPKQEEKLRAAGRKEAGADTGFWAAAYALYREFTEAPLATAMRPILALLSRTVGLIDQLEADQSPEYVDAMAAVIEAELNIPVNRAELLAAWFGRGRLGGMDAVGSTFFDLLAALAVTPEGAQAPGAGGAAGGAGIGGLPSGTLDPAQGVAAARRFLGFLISNAARSGNVAVLTEMASFGQFENFARYGEAISNNLSFSRLARAGLGPLVEICLRDPLGWALNAQYRPQMLSAAATIKAYFAGFISRAEMLRDLSYLGYSDQRIAALEAASDRELTVRQLETLRVFGVIDDTDYTQRLKLLGYGPDTLPLLLETLKREPERDAALVVLKRVAALYGDGVISAPQLQSVFDRFPALDTEKAGIIAAENEVRALPRRLPSVADLREAVQQRVISRADMEDYLVRMGYDAEARRILLGTPWRTLSLGQMREAFVHTTIALGEFRDYLDAEGYAPDAATILVIEALRDKLDFDEAEKRKAEREAERAAKAALQPPAPGTP